LTATTEAGVSIALSALDDGTEGELVSAALDLAVLDEDGFQPIGRAEVADALDSADLSSAS
jgi:hypothetical protein